MVFLVAQISAVGQSSAPQSFKLTGIHFAGLNRFTQEQAVAASGLRPGDSVTAQQLAAAQQILIKSGVFENVGYRYTTHGNELTADFQVKESLNVLRCAFDNFVWFSPDELDQSLRRRVALYVGLAPASGTTLQDITDALNALLRSNGINGTVEEIAFSPSVGAAPDRLLFEVKGVSMPVRSVHFPGSSGLSEQQLAAASVEMIGQDFSISHWDEYVSFGLVPLYKRNGYLKAHFGDPVGRPMGAANAGSPVEVTVTLPVEEGLQYFWDKSTWAGNQQLQGEELNHLLGMKQKDVANQDKIDAGMRAVRKAYSVRGFIEADLGPKPNLNDAERLAGYDFTVTEGTQYHMGQIHFGGLPIAAAQELTKNWKLKPGDVFDATYLDTFIQNVAMKKLTEMGIKKIHVRPNSKPDKEKAIVDLYVEFQ